MKTAVLSLLAAGAMVSAHKASTTSTVYTTSVYTITSCHPTVTNCPAKMGQVTTDIISLYTTVCPVTETESPSSTMTPPPMSTSAPYSTSTIYETTEYTITSCPPEVTNCPVGSKTSSVITSTTICPPTMTSAPAPPPMTSAGYSVSTIYTTTEYTITKCPASVTNCPYGSKTTETITSTTICPPTMTSAPAPPPMSSPMKSSGGVVPPPMSMSSPAGPSLSVMTISTCVPSYITSVITVTPSATVCPGCAQPTSYSPPPKTNGTVVPFTGGASAKQAGGLLMAVGIAAALL